MAQRRMNRRKSKVPPAQLKDSVVKAVKSIVDAKMNKVIEIKRNDYFNEPFPATAYYHNVWYNHDFNALYCNQGVRDEEGSTSNNRLGDSIYAKSLHLRLLVTQFYDRPNMAIRILVLKVKSGLSLSNPTAHAQTGNVIVNPINTELPNLLGVVYDKTFITNNNAGPLTGAWRDTKFLWTKTIPINKRIRYPDGAPDPSDYTYRVYTALYDTQGALTTDNVGRFSYFRSLHFQDA